MNACSDVASRQKERACEPRREDQARVVVLKDALGHSFEEVSAAAGMPVGTAKCYAHRGRNWLRDKLSDVA
ncbi:hypothetical protein BH18ACT12_BH18ACT12_21690 [soil metagenome]